MWGARHREVERITRTIAESRRSGRCVYEADWSVASANDIEDIYQAILTWCRDTLATVRRPWGIDGFDLAASRLVRGGQPESLSMRGLRPLHLYGETGIPALRSFVLGARPEPQRIAVALFSWGDAAHLALR